MCRLQRVSRLSWFGQILFMMALAVGDEARAQNTTALSDKAFNPAISLILDGQFGAFSNDEELRDVPGFQIGEESSGFDEGFTLNESELVFQANIDDKFFGFATIALESEAGETEVALEEAWLQTLGMPFGLQVKAGRLFSGVGYLNGFHPHATAFADDPLVYRVFFDGRLADTGFQLTWTPATLLYMQFGVEAFSGSSFPAAGRSHDGVGAGTLFARFGGDFNISNSWLAGISWIIADAMARESGGTAGETGIDPLFTGDSDTWVGSFVWKWSPRGNPARQNFKLAAEYFSREEEGGLSVGGDTGYYRGDQSGYYIEGVWQFHAQWRAGLRYGSLSSNNAIGDMATPLVVDEDGFDPEKWSAMIDFRNSEFSTLRLQYTRDESNPVRDNQIIVQYIMSMGAHGGHTF